MKIRNITLIISIALLLAGTASSAESDSSESQALLGVYLDTTALPELLTKHLQLSPGQGVRIRNIQKNSPAEEAGLERDDIIIRIKDKDVYKYESVVFAVQESEVSEEIPIEIIHLGEHKKLKIRLEAIEGEPEWKYPPEPEIEQSLSLGKVYTMSPEGSWVEILTDELPQGLDFNNLFREFYKTYYTKGNSIKIEGNPNDEDSKIIIRDGDTKYETTIKEIDKLPEKYRDAAEKAIKNAREKRDIEAFKYSPKPPADFNNFYFQQPNLQRLPSEPMLQQEGQFFENLQKQMNQLTDQIKELEKNQSELLKRLSEKHDNQQS